jgi:hypothetical protein
VAPTDVDVSIFPRQTETVAYCLMTSGPAVSQHWWCNRFRISGATLVLKRLTLYSHCDAQTREVFGGAYTDAPGRQSRVDSDCPLPAARSTRRRHGSLQAPCSLWASEVLPYTRTENAPGCVGVDFERGFVRMAACAGWTDVVIPGDVYLRDLPVGLLQADVNTRSGHDSAEGYSPLSGGADERRGRRGRRLESVCRYRSGRTRCDESVSAWGGGGISCQNNQEVTL